MQFSIFTLAGAAMLSLNYKKELATGIELLVAAVVLAISQVILLDYE